MRVPITIRQATPADAEAVADVWLASFKATYSFPAAHTDEEVRGWIHDHLVLGEETFVAVAPGGEVVGLMSLEGDDLDQLYVHPDYFDLGIGSRFVALAKERRPGGIGLYTFQVNERARAFYERRGFRVERLGDGEGNEEQQPDVRYEWSPTADT
jgi:ribosomal protein S18 acetylase RimI-like enzyme